MLAIELVNDTVDLTNLLKPCAGERVSELHVMLESLIEYVQVTAYLHLDIYIYIYINPYVILSSDASM